MTDRYKFRGKHHKTKEWAYGYYIEQSTANGAKPMIIKTYYPTNKIESVAVIPETVGQYIGLKDKNGVEIYEGDVVRVYGGEYCQGYWEHDHQCTVKDIRYDSYELGEYEYIEVIGNIHDTEVQDESE